MIRSNCFTMASRWSKMRINCAGRTIICQEIERKGPGDRSVVRGKSVAFLAVLLALKLSRKFQTGNRQSQLGWIQWGKTKRSKRDRDREREREVQRRRRERERGWKMEGWVARGKKRIYHGSGIERVLSRGRNADSLFNASYGHSEKDSIKASLHYCRSSKPTFFCIADYVIVILFYSEQMAEIFFVTIEGIKNREWYASK